jgi:hypothetical protein
MKRQAGYGSVTFHLVLIIVIKSNIPFILITFHSCFPYEFMLIIFFVSESFSILIVFIGIYQRAGMA